MREIERGKEKKKRQIVISNKKYVIFHSNNFEYVN